MSGLSGEVRFDPESLRSIFNIEVYEVVGYDCEPIAKYNSMKGLVYTRSKQTQDADKHTSIKYAHLKVISSIVCISLDNEFENIY